LQSEEPPVVAPDEEDDEEFEITYKLGNPSFNLDAEWTITLSKNEFPWHEIAFEPFTPKECYEKYSSIVRDP